jgi:hypothetical protein
MKIVLCTALSGACARARTQQAKAPTGESDERKTRARRRATADATSVKCHLSTIAGTLSDRSIETLREVHCCLRTNYQKIRTAVLPRRSSLWPLPWSPPSSKPYSKASKHEGEAKR